MEKTENRIFALQALSHSYNMIGGYPGKAVPLYKLHVEQCEAVDDREKMAEGLANFGKGLRQSGNFREAEAMGMRGLVMQREVGNRLKEAINLYWVGMGLAHRGVDDGRPEIAMNRAIRICESLLADRSIAIVNSFLAQHYLWLGQPESALEYAEKAWDSAVALEKSNHHNLNEVVMVLCASARMCAEVAMHAGNYELAESKLNFVMQRCKDIDFVEEILPALRVWAELERKRGDTESARIYLRQTWSLAERGPFPLYNSDSYNTLARIELGEGNREAAIEAANTAYRLAWCDGPPYAYQRGLDEALEVLNALDQAPPDLPAYDNSRYSPIADVALNPQDEFFS
ncbi:tetratricopeptide repeat protein [Oceanicoccus sagamiensis]|nr:hypothetical protein [Oceanicoccus sagamiensis]